MFTYYSAIDIAMQNNQVRAINLMINHIIKYQNTFVSSFLFKNNLLSLMERGIETNNLLKSNVFIYKFEFDEWPAAHTELEKMIMPYNGSVFDIRNAYNEVFEGLGDPQNDP